MNAFAEALGAFGGTVFRWSAIAFVLINGAAAAAIFFSRDRAIVNRWTPRLLALNLLLLGGGLGVPAISYCLKAVVSAVSVSQSTEVHINRE